MAGEWIDFKQMATDQPKQYTQFICIEILNMQIQKITIENGESNVSFLFIAAVDIRVRM